MGMYTELNIGVRFKKDLPLDVLKALQYITSELDPHEKEIDFATDHSLFKTDRWKWMLRSGGSYYFDTKPMLYWAFDDIAQAWNLSFVTNIKNYTSEWEEFLKFIAPHVDDYSDEDSKPHYIGTYRYEEDDEPTLVFISKGKAFFKMGEGILAEVK
jgi:hypothetical protein